MKIINLFKSIPFLATLIILIFLSFNNQKEYIKLKILIWNTPSLSLGTYLAISTGTGYLLSYIITTTLVQSHKSTLKNNIKYRSDSYSENNISYQQPIKEIIYDNTLIERDIKDPSPTINANFRVIGKNNKRNQSIDNNDLNEYYDSDITQESDYQNYEKEFNNKNTYETNTIENDWEDDPNSSW